MSHFAYKRSQRLNDLFREWISTMLLNDVKDPRVVGVAITRVEVTEDLQNAKIFFRSLHFGNDAVDQIKTLETSLQNLTGFLRHQLKKQLYLKKIPLLQFIFDAAPEEQARMEKIFRDIAQEQAQRKSEEPTHG